MKLRARLVAAGTLWAVAAAGGAPVAGEAAGSEVGESDLDRRAEALFYGSDATGIKASIGAGGTRLPARLFPCANCHGGDGAGGAEGALRVPAITAPPGVGDGAKRHEAPGAAELLRALTEGRGRDGRALDRAMPRYWVSAGEAAALTRFLRRLPVEQGRGITATEVRVVVVHDARTAPIAQDFAAGFRAAVGSRAYWGRRVQVTLHALPTTEDVLVAASASGVGAGLSAAAAAAAEEAFLLAGTALSDPAARAAIDGAGAVQLAPLGPVADSAVSEPTAGAGDGTVVLPLCATGAATLAALATTLPAGTAVAVAADPREAAAATAAIEGLGLRPADLADSSAPVLLLSRRPEAVGRAAAAPAVLAPAEMLAGAPLERLREAGVALTLADGCGGLPGMAAAGQGVPRAERLGQLAGRATAAALGRTGRMLGRWRFLRALEKLAASPGAEGIPGGVGAPPRIVRLGGAGQ